MSLEMRRKAKANATPETTPATTEAVAAAATVAVATPRKKREKKEVKASGSMRTIANGRHYKDGHVAVLDENGMPKSRSVFDPAGRAAGVVDIKGFDKNKILPLKDLIQHLNQELFRPLFGTPLRGNIARDLVMGFADVLTTLSENGVTYRIPNGFSAETIVRKPRKGHNPKTKAPVDIPEQRAIRMKPTRAVKAFIAASE